MKALLIAMLIGLLLTQAGCYSMHKAAGSGNTDEVRKLVKDGNIEGYTALGFAKYYGNHKMIKVLEEKGVKE